MIQIVEVESLPSKGMFRPGTIMLRKGLAPDERRRVLRHEAAHARFYTYNRLGKFLVKLTEKPLNYAAYGFFILITWFLNGYEFLASCIPLYLQFGHEILTCLRYGGKRSFTLSLGLAVALVLFGYMRLLVKFL